MALTWHTLQRIDANCLRMSPDVTTSQTHSLKCKCMCEVRLDFVFVAVWLCTNVGEEHSVSDQ